MKIGTVSPGKNHISAIYWAEMKIIRALKIKLFSLFLVYWRIQGLVGRHGKSQEAANQGFGVLCIEENSLH
jgi:hypothetical protein